MENTVYVKGWFLKKIEHEKGCKIFSFVGTVLKETEKAVFVKFEEAHSYKTGDDYAESWVPKSCLYSEEEAARFEANIEKATAQIAA